MYEPVCPDCGSPLIIRLSVADGNRRGKAIYKCRAIATIYGLILPDNANRGCVEYLKEIISCKK